MKIFKKFSSGASAVLLSAAMLLNCAVAFGAEQERPPELTVEQATANAISASSTIKTLDDSNTSADESIAKLKEQIWNETDWNKILSLSTKIMELEANQSSNTNNKQLQKDKLKNSITIFFASVISAEKAMELYDQSLEIQKKQLAIARVNVSLGKISQVSYDEQKSSYDKAVSERASKLVDIDNAYASLNQVMNRKLTTRYTLVLDLKYASVGQINASTLASSAISQSPDVKDREDAIRIAQYKLDTLVEEYDIYGKVVDNGGESREKLELNLQQAYRDLDDTKSALEKSAQTLCSKITSQEIQYKSMVIDLENMKKQLEVKEKQYELGKITEITLLSHKYDIARQEESIRSLVYDHAINAMTIKNPSLL